MPGLILFALGVAFAVAGHLVLRYARRVRWTWQSHIGTTVSHIVPEDRYHERTDHGHCTVCEPLRVVVGGRTTYIHLERQPA